MRKRKTLERLGLKVYEMQGLDKRLLEIKRSFDQVSLMLGDKPQREKRK